MTFQKLLQRAAILIAFVMFAAPGAMAQPARPAAPDANAHVAAAAAAPAGYILGPEDVVEVDVLGRADFNTKAKLGPDGTIQLPYLGSVAAGNRTAADLREQVRRDLEKGGYFAKPVVSVTIVSYASRYVTVLGSVTTPGLIPVDRPYRLSEIVARVGGVREDAADYVVLRSGDQPERRLLIKSLATGDSNEDPPVAPGDKVYVPKAELFFISGQIKAPGGYPMTNDMTLRMAISRGGGLTDSGSDRRIKLTRQGRKLDHIDLDAKIEAGDVIVVGERLF